MFDAFEQQHIDVGDGHLLFVQQAGNRGGVPAVGVHGGPGIGFGDNVLELFDDKVHRFVCYDQRGAGRTWAGDSRVNIRKSKAGKAKPSQVRQVLKALDKLKEQQK